MFVSRCSSFLFHCGMLVWVHIDTLIIVARVLYDVYCWNLLIVNIMYASCECNNFVSVDPMMMILICTHSTLHDIHVCALCVHLRLHFDILIPVARVHVAVNC